VGALKRLRQLRTRGAGGLLLIAATIAVAAAYQLLFGDETVQPQVRLPVAAATIGSGEGAVAVSPSGEVLPWLVLAEEVQLPRLPLSAVPEKPRLGGPALEQALVLGAAPAALRPYLEGSAHGEAGVYVELRSGIELRFGDATRREEKWKAAAAVLADPEIVALDYVDLTAPKRPGVGGSAHTLPPVP
jgi:cell division protein FtsQ